MVLNSLWLLQGENNGGNGREVHVRHSVADVQPLQEVSWAGAAAVRHLQWPGITWASSSDDQAQQGCEQVKIEAASYFSFNAL